MFKNVQYNGYIDKKIHHWKLIDSNFTTLFATPTSSHADTVGGIGMIYYERKLNVAQNMALYYYSIGASIENVIWAFNRIKYPQLFKYKNCVIRYFKQYKFHQIF